MEIWKKMWVGVFFLNTVYIFRYVRDVCVVPCEWVQLMVSEREEQLESERASKAKVGWSHDLGVHVDPLDLLALNLSLSVCDRLKQFT